MVTFLNLTNMLKAIAGAVYESQSSNMGKPSPEASVSLWWMASYNARGSECTWRVRTHLGSTRFSQVHNTCVSGNKGVLLNKQS